MKAAFRVWGRVQGVGYRAFAMGEARAAGLGGWVRNRIDEAVEGQVEGREDQLSHFRERLRQGPPWGRVDGLEWVLLDGEAPSPSESLPRPFEIRR